MILYIRGQGEGAGADNSNSVNFEYHRKLLALRTFAVCFFKGLL